MESARDGWKLVRYKTPDVVWAKEGKRMTTRPVADADEHAAFLRAKIAEEALEVSEATAGTFVAEMADVRQALTDFCHVAGIRLEDLRAPEPEGAAPRKEDAVRVFRERIDRLVALSRDIPDDDRAAARVSDILAALASITHLAGIRQHVRDELKRKFDERGGFVPGVLWKVWTE